MAEEVFRPIEREVEEERKKPELYIAYPAMQKKVFPKGKTIIDWREGSVLLADGTEEPLNLRLPSDRQLRSLRVITEARLVAELSGGEVSYTFPIFPNEMVIPRVEFNYTTLETYRITTAFIIASTDPTGVEHIRPAFFEGKPFTKQDTVTTAGEPEVLDVREFLGSNAHTGTIENRSDAETLYVYLSDDAETYTDAIPIEAAQGLNLEKEDVAIIKIDASADNTPYFIFAH